MNPDSDKFTINTNHHKDKGVKEYQIAASRTKTVWSRVGNDYLVRASVASEVTGGGATRHWGLTW